jgi:hypothetical protein
MMEHLPDQQTERGERRHRRHQNVQADEDVVKLNASMQNQKNPRGF